MKKEIIVLLAEVLIILAFAPRLFAQDLAWEDIGRGYTGFSTLITDPDNPRIIYAGVSNSVIKTEDAGKSWRVVLNVKGQNGMVNSFSVAACDKNSVYAATGNGLYYSKDSGKNWKRIFQGKNNFENECLSLAVLPQEIYLGTKAGLFISKDKGRSWQKQASRLGDSQILAITYPVKGPQCIYVACTNGVFKTEDSGQSWEEIFVALAFENGEDTQEENEDIDEQEKVSAIRYLSIDQNNLNNLYLATSSGVMESPDKGKTWKRVSSYGLLSKEVNFILVSGRQEVYVNTKSGIFEYKDNRWYELSLRLLTKKINLISLDKQNNIYAACSDGLFRANLNYPKELGQNNLTQIYFNGEPKIDEIQLAAIKYAQVEPEKIKDWQERAKKKALFPQVSVGMDRNTGDLWHWEGGSTTKTDDDVLRRGRDTVDWDIRLNWDLGELIWNNDQTSIDTRSRLMVQLREDLLDQVTKIYFERIRVKTELDNLPIEDKKKRFDKELRIQELTASLDALTGGYFSKKNPNSNVGI